MAYVDPVITKDAMVGPEGCKLELEDCYIIFPPGSVRDEEHISLELHGDCSVGCPDGYAAITPKLVCKTQREVILRSAVEVMLPTWCLLQSYDDDVIAHIVRSNDSGTRAIDKCSLKKAKLGIKFQTDTLSSFWAQIQSITCNKVELRLQPEVYYSKDGIFSSVLMNRGAITKEIRQKMENDGNVRVPVSPNIFVAKNRDDIKISIKVESMEDSEVFKFEPHSVRFIVDEDFVQNPRKYLRQQILPCPKPGQFLEFDYVVVQNGKETRHAFTLSWPGSAPPRSFIDEED